MDSSESRFSISGIRVLAGERREIYLKVSESYLSGSIQIPVTVIRGRKPGQTAFVIGAVHGDEINGADIVRRLIFDIDHDKLSGTLIAIPVANIQGFLSQSRYLPYHRDLNRFFPGDPKGNNAERIAARLFKEVVSKCDFGIDLHTAADGRLNLPHVRGDMKNPKVRELARAFGSTVLMNQPGVRGSLRREATESGVPTILFEAGEARKFSPKVSMAGLKGVLNVLSSAGMWPEHERVKPPFQVIVQSSDWIRAEKGGILDLEIKPGELVYKDDLIGTILNPFGKTVTQIRSPVTGIAVGLTTAPLTSPGTGIVHVAKLKKALALVERALRARRTKKKATKAKSELRSRAILKKRLRGSRALAVLGAFVASGAFSGCGAMSASVLRHQTGESLGSGRVKFSARIESARMTPIVAPTAASATTEQTNDVYQAASFGVQGEVGVTQLLDVQLATVYSRGGGGWRVGAKHELKKFSGFVLAVMGGYGSYFGSGDVTYLTPTTPETLYEALSANMIDLGAPISYRLGANAVVYSGLTFFRSNVKGSVGDAFVETTTFDTGLNLGLRFGFGQFAFDIEGAVIRGSDPFLDTTRLIPFIGLSAGIVF